MGADARNDGNPLIVFAVATSVVLVFLLVSFSMRLSIGRAQRRLDAPEPGTMRSGTTFVMAAVAMCSILAMVASTTVWISKALGDAVAHSGVTQVGAGQIEYPAEAGWFALAAFVGFVVLFGIIAIRIGTLRWFRWRNDVAKGICEEYDVVPPPALSDEPPRCEPLRDPATQDVGDHYGWRLKYAKRIRTRRLWANLIDEIDWMITSAVMATLAALGASVVARMRDEQPGGHVDDAVAIATWVLTFLAIAVFFLVRSARDDRQLRGTVGILWEVMGFFPRRFHPLAPPCYSERTVIELRNRVIEYTKADDDGGKIILAHSQGTMLTTAALLSLNGPPPTIPAPKQAVPKGSELDHLAFVTYGCMLERLFRRGMARPAAEAVPGQPQGTNRAWSKRPERVGDGGHATGVPNAERTNKVDELWPLHGLSRWPCLRAAPAEANAKSEIRRVGHRRAPPGRHHVPGSDTPLAIPRRNDRSSCLAPLVQLRVGH